MSDAEPPPDLPHLPLLFTEPNPDRRRRTFVPPPRPPVERGQTAQQLVEQLDRIESGAVPAHPSLRDFQPHLVFRVPLCDAGGRGPVIGALEKAGVAIVSIESDGAIVGFRDDSRLEEFRAAAEAYRRGPTINSRTGLANDGTQWDVFEYIDIEGMRSWNRSDRVGCRLAEVIGGGGESCTVEREYVVDVELWHGGSRDAAQRSLGELRAIVARDGARTDERVTDTFVGEQWCLARARVSPDTLDLLLNWTGVAEVEFPPQPTLDAAEVRRMTPQQLPTAPTPPADGPCVCVLDTGVVAGHPLLANHVQSATAHLTATVSPADQNGHGTMVAGIAAFGDVRECIERGELVSPVRIFSARVLNERNRFDDERLIVNQMEDVVSAYVAEPFNCRVFNISIGAGEAWLCSNQRQSAWAEALDHLARKYDVVIVVSAGNLPYRLTQSPRAAEDLLSGYPIYLQDPDSGICDPGTAAIVITVGGYCSRDSIAIPRGAREGDIIRPLAAMGEPSPITRVGPGYAGAVKPDFVAPAGNIAFRGPSGMANVGMDDGLAILSFSHEPTSGLFRFDVGTSYAAPFVSRTAAMLTHLLARLDNERPQANLVRALLAASADPPPPTERLSAGDWPEFLRHCYGYGVINERAAHFSANSRVTLIHQGELAIDTFVIYEVPVPAEFKQAEGNKSVTVTLAFDPPVRRRRADYAGVEMGFRLYRGTSVDEIVEAHRQLTSEERAELKRVGRKPLPPPSDSRNCELRPTETERSSCTLQRAKWNFTREGRDYGETYFLLVKSARKWAPPTIVSQRYAVTVTLEADDERIYSMVRARIRERVREHARLRRSIGQP